MAKEPLTTRLDADTKREVENYAEEHDIGQTEAARRLIRAGLAKEGRPIAATDGGAKTLLERLAAPKTFTIGVGAAFIGTVLILAAVLVAPVSLAAGLGALIGGALIGVMSIVIIAVAALARAALDKPLRGLVLDVEESEAA